MTDNPTITQYYPASNRPTVLAVIADQHSNLRMALRPESFMDDNGGSSVASKIQYWLLDRWQEYIEAVKAAALIHNARIYVLNLGDALDVDFKNRSSELISRIPLEAVNIAYEVQKMIRDVADRYILIRGTEAHAGPSSSYEEQLGEKLEAERDDIGHYSWWWWTGIINGVYIEAAHHTVSGRRPSMRAGAVARLAEETILEYAGTKDRVPDLVLRGHIHQFADSAELVPGCRAMTLPCWTFANAHVHRIGKGHVLPHIGGSIIVCDNGRFEVDTKIYQPMRRQAWRPMN